jgi:hypothetical protein
LNDRLAKDVGFDDGFAEGLSRVGLNDGFAEDELSENDDDGLFEGTADGKADRFSTIDGLTDGSAVAATPTLFKLNTKT